MKTRRSFTVKHLALLSSFLFFSSSAIAQFGKFLEQLQQAVQQGSAPAQGGARAQGGLFIPSEQWCKTQAGVVGEIKGSEGVIASEFRIANLESLQDEFFKVKDKRKISRTFPDWTFFQSSFETPKVRAIYDVFWAFPEPATLAALIELSRSSDAQERTDALMALVFIHLQAPGLSIHANRWKEIFQSASAGKHWTALVFKARVLTFGEYAPKDIPEALFAQNEAGSLVTTYAQSGRQFDWDTQNYQLVHKHTTAYIYATEPNLPMRNMYTFVNEQVRRMEAGQEEYRRRFPSTRLGKIYAKAMQINDESIAIGQKIIEKSQGGNQLAGQIASNESLRAAQEGGKPLFVNTKPHVQAAQWSVINMLPTVNPEQQKLMAQAQTQRLLAQGLLAQSIPELMSEMMSGGMGDFVKSAAPLPALTEANNAIIQSCIITAKWDQAMRVKNVPKVEPKRLMSEVGSLTKDLKDD